MIVISIVAVATELLVMLEFMVCDTINTEKHNI